TASRAGAIGRGNELFARPHMGVVEHLDQIVDRAYGYATRAKLADGSRSIHALEVRDGLAVELMTVKVGACRMVETLIVTHPEHVDEAPYHLAGLGGIGEPFSVGTSNGVARRVRLMISASAGRHTCFRRLDEVGAKQIKQGCVQTGVDYRSPA